MEPQIPSKLSLAGCLLAQLNLMSLLPMSWSITHVPLVAMIYCTNFGRWRMDLHLNLFSSQRRRRLFNIFSLNTTGWILRDLLCLYLDVAISKHPGELHKQAVHRFISFERSLHAKNIFVDFKPVTEEYFQMSHAEPVPKMNLGNSAERYTDISIVTKV